MSPSGSGTNASSGGRVPKSASVSALSLIITAGNLGHPAILRIHGNGGGAWPRAGGRGFDVVRVTCSWGGAWAWWAWLKPGGRGLGMGWGFRLAVFGFHRVGVASARRTRLWVGVASSWGRGLLGVCKGPEAGETRGGQWSACSHRT